MSILLTRSFVFSLLFVFSVGWGVLAQAQSSDILYVDQSATAEAGLDHQDLISDHLIYLGLDQEIWQTSAYLKGTNEDLRDEEEHSIPITEISEKLRHYPNPVRRSLTIEDPNQSVTQIIAYNEAGQRLFERKREGLQKFFIIDMEHLPDGVYYFRLVAEGDLLLKRFRVIKQKKS